MSDTSRAEAVFFFRLMKRGESLDKLREGIRGDQNIDPRMALFRESVLSHFDEFVAAGRVVRVPTPRNKTVRRRRYKRRSNSSNSVDSAGILRAIREGKFRLEIAEQFKCNPSTVSRVASENGLNCAKQKPRGRPLTFTSDKIALAKQLLEKGAFASDVARRFGVTSVTILRHCRGERNEQKAQ